MGVSNKNKPADIVTDSHDDKDLYGHHQNRYRRHVQKSGNTTGFIIGRKNTEY